MDRQPPAQAPGRPVWAQFLGTGDAPNPAYYDSFNKTLPEVLERAPRRILELGCAGGRLGEHLRGLYPDVHHTGIEMHPGAAALARTRLARVIEKRLEDIDFAQEGIAPGSIDTFIACDVLEHLHDPWRALVRVRPLLTADAQVALSLPNARNLQLVDELHNRGTWNYAAAGILDVTHVRFFALRDIVRMLDETGYRVGYVKANIDARYESILEQNKGRPSVTLQIGRVRLENLPAEELLEYCTLQWVLRGHPKAEPANDPSA